MIAGRWSAFKREPFPWTLHIPLPLPRIPGIRMLLSATSLSGDASSSSPSGETRATPHTAMDAFESFFWQYEHDILGYLWRLTGDEQAAYDLSQETFVRAWQHFEKLQRYEQPRAWLFRVASNLGVNHLRGRSRHGQHTVATDDMQSKVMPGGDPAHRLAENDAICQTLLGLPPRQRAAVALCDVYGFSSVEAAAALGVSHGSLKMSLWRGRERFRQEYARQGDAK